MLKRLRILHVYEKLMVRTNSKKTSSWHFAIIYISYHADLFRWLEKINAFSILARTQNINP